MLMPKSTASLIPFRLSGLILTLIVLGSAAALPGAAASFGQPGDESATFERVAALAAQARETGELGEAARRYREAVTLRSDWMEGWWYLGTLLYDLDRFGEALEALRVLASFQRENAVVWALIGLCEYQERDYERALVNLQKSRLLGISENAQMYPAVRYHAAILLNRFEEFEVAFEALKEFAVENNRSASVIEAMGISVLRLPYLPSELPPGKREQVILAGSAGYESASRRQEIADELYQRLVREFPDQPNVHYAYGVFLMREEPEKALEYFQKELKIQPRHVPSMLQTAFEYLKRGAYQEAQPWAEKSAELDPTSFPARHALGRIFLEFGEIERSIAELEQGIQLAPTSPELRFVLSRAYARAGRREDAEREREEYLRLDEMFQTQKYGAQAVGGERASDQPPPGP